MARAYVVGKGRTIARVKLPRGKRMIWLQSRGRGKPKRRVLVEVFRSTRKSARVRPMAQHRAGRVKPPFWVRRRSLKLARGRYDRGLW